MPVRPGGSGVLLKGQPADGTALGSSSGQGPVGAVLVGDSHSSAVVTAVAEAAGTRNASVLHYSFDACPIVEGITHLNKRFASCPRFITDALRHIAGQPVRVPLIVVNRWSAYVEGRQAHELEPVSYTHLRAHETVLDLVCRLLLEKKKQQITRRYVYHIVYP